MTDESPETPPNRDGETEMLGDVEVTHRFLEAIGPCGPIQWHYVEAGIPGAPAILFLHGNPESWRSWEPQIEHFSKANRVVAVDLKGYGQGDKRPGDWRWENVAEELLALLDDLGLQRFTLVAHDRGAVLADYLGGKHPDRVDRYVRMQQLCHIADPANSPQIVYFADPIFGPYIFGHPDYYFRFRLLKMLKNPVDPKRLETIKREMRYPGMADAVVRYYQASSLEKERLDRIRLFPNMTFPVLLLQGDMDDGQPPWYYDHPLLPATACFRHARLRWVHGAGHYTNLEKPEVVTASIQEFLAETGGS